MKKLVSIILVFAMILSVAIVPAFADTTDTEYLCKDKLIDYYELYEEEWSELLGYDEIYYHHVDENDINSEIDWVLIFAYTYMCMESNCWMILDDSRVLAQDCMDYPFTFCYGVYDVKEDKFFGIDEYTDYSKYNGLEEYVNTHLGDLIGDADGDDALTIMDSTFIQMAIAQLCEFSPEDYIGVPACPVQYLSDMNRDGERSILDATAIQLKLAGIDNKPVVNEEMIMTVISSSSLEQPKPENAVKVPFEKKYSAQQFLSPAYIDSAIPSDDTIVVIKSNEQYKSIFNDRAPEFTDEFFESQWLVATFIRTGCYEAVAPIGDISKCGDTLYVTANVYVPDDSGELQPLDPFWLSIAAVDREYLEDVYNVVKAK